MNNYYVVVPALYDLSKHSREFLSSAFEESTLGIKLFNKKEDALMCVFEAKKNSPVVGYKVQSLIAVKGMGTVANGFSFAACLVNEEVRPLEYQSQIVIVLFLKQYYPELIKPEPLPTPVVEPRKVKCTCVDVKFEDSDKIYTFETSISVNKGDLLLLENNTSGAYSIGMAVSRSRRRVFFFGRGDLPPYSSVVQVLPKRVSIS